MKLSKTQHKIYDVVISTLAIAAVALVLIDLSQGLTAWQQTADRVILGVFTLDYIVRFYNAPDKLFFVKTNICDLIAIFPFHTLFRAFKITALARIAKFAKIPRLFAFLYRPGYYGAAEPPVRCGESHLSGLTEPPIYSYSA